MDSFATTNSPSIATPSIKFLFDYTQKLNIVSVNVVITVIGKVWLLVLSL